MSIGVSSNAFLNYGDILSVVFGSQCANVGENAFANCKNLRKINDNNVIAEIGSSAFKSCSNLSEITFNKLITLHEGAFENCSKLKEINIPSVSSIGSSAFASCSNLKSVNLSSEYSVNVSAFENCISLQNINLDICTNISDNAFCNCQSLSNINFKKCSTIGENAFASCNGLNTITFDSCTSIGTNAFINCINLSNIYINDTNKDLLCTLNNHAFCSCSNDLSQCSNSNITFYIKPETIELYKTASNWSHYSNKFITQPSYNQIVYTLNENGSGTNNETLQLHTDFTKKYTVKSSEKYNNNVILTLEKITTDSNSDNDFVFNLDCKIFSDGDKNRLTSIIIPPNCEIIGTSAFESCENLKTITLSNSLKNINNSAFKNCKSLINIELPNTLESIGIQSFYGCESLTSFKLPDSLGSIGVAVFGMCKNIEKFEGKFVKYNGNAVVYNNNLIAVAPKSNIKYYKLSDIDGNISQLNRECFSCCDNIRRVDIDLKLDTLERYFVFHNCENLYEVHVEGNIGYIYDNNQFIWYGNSQQSNSQHPKVKVIIGTVYNISNNITRFNSTYIQILPKPNDNEIIYCTKDNENINSILRDKDTTIKEIISIYTNRIFYTIKKSNNFYLCQNFFKGLPVTEVLIGNNFNRIQNDVFMNCENLTYIDMPNIQNIQNNCFNNCKNLTKICIPPNLVPFSFINTFYGCENLREFISYKNEYVSDDNMCYIKDNNLWFFAQGGLSEEGKYTIPDNINTIWFTVFKNCSKLKEITIPNNVTYINEAAFDGCTNLKTINLSQTNSRLNTINNYSFRNCTSLESMVLPNNLTHIGNSAFEGCNQYKGNYTIDDEGNEIDGGIEINTNVKYIGNKCFYGTNISKLDIKSTKLTSIGESAFEGCTNLSDVKIVAASPIQTINKKAFYGCSNIKNTVTIPTTVTTIGESAFEGCVNLTLNDTNVKYVTTIGISAFKGCENITRIDINNSISTINKSVFEGCTKLETIYISRTNSKLDTIGNSSFKNCKSLTSMNLPDTLTSIGDSAYEGCENLKKINISYDISKLDTIGNSSFKNCKSLTSMNLPDTLTSIGHFAYEGCEQYEGNYTGGILGIKKNITFIGNKCFYGTKIQTLTINSTKLITIPTSAFEACAELTTVSIPIYPQLTTIGANAFKNCTKLNKFKSVKSGELILPNTIQHVGDYAFFNCNISKIDLKNNKSLLDIGNYCFVVNTHDGTIFPTVYVPEVSSEDSISIFKMNGVENSGSNPINYGETKIYVKSNIIDSYKKNLFWQKYKNFMISY